MSELYGGVTGSDTVGVDPVTSNFPIGGVFGSLTYLPDGSGTNYTTDITISGFSVKQKTIGASTLNAGIYNPIDIGFVAGFGAEIRLWRRTVLALQMRADIGISDVERTKKLKITLSKLQKALEHSFIASNIK